MMRLFCYCSSTLFVILSARSTLAWREGLIFPFMSRRFNLSKRSKCNGYLLRPSTNINTDRDIPLNLRGGGDEESQGDDNDDDVRTIDLNVGKEDDVLQPSIQEPRVWSSPRRALVLMDVFSEYHGIFLSHRARDVYGVATISVLSNYMKGYFEKQKLVQQDMEMCEEDAADAEEELAHWRKEYMPDEDELHEWLKPLKSYELVAISCESDSGLADAERFGTILNVTHHNGFNEARRNKYEMMETMRSAELPVIRQRLCSTVEEAVDFAQQLGMIESHVQESNSTIVSESEVGWVVVKPVRGVASDDVHLCKDLTSVENAFKKILGSSVFGSPSEQHESVLVQEFAAGQEFAIDIVSRDGEHKAAAIWIYDKRPANNAPFVYFATELYGGDAAPILHDYASKALDALGVRWGLTHTEVIITKDGPRLVEVNCRQHNMDFLPLTMGCIGYNKFDMLLAAYFGGKTTEPSASGSLELQDHRLEWDLLPELPMKRMNGAMVHLSCFVSGKLRSLNEEALMEIQKMESVMDLEVYPPFLEIGNEIRPTIDIRTDCGWVQLLNPDPVGFSRDYDRIMELMKSLFEVEESTE